MLVGVCSGGVGVVAKVVVVVTGGDMEGREGIEIRRKCKGLIGIYMYVFVCMYIW